MVPPPIRVSRSKLQQTGELERAVHLAAAKVGLQGIILILLDADYDCPVTLAKSLKERAVQARNDIPIYIVIAKTEYEAWFIASAKSLALLPDGEDLSIDPEEVRGAKEWIESRLSQDKYSETADQPSLTAAMRLEEARRAPSFNKLIRDLIALAQRAED